MPRSAIGMSEFDGDYVFNTNQYLIDSYPTMTKPDRRAICSKVSEELDIEEIQGLVDGIVLQYLLEEKGWYTPDEEDDE